MLIPSITAANNKDDMIDALTAVVEELETGRLQPVINKSNHSSLATAIRDCFKLARLKTAVDVEEQRDAIARAFDYWLESPLEWIVEVGLGKLRKDCVAILGGEDVVSGAHKLHLSSSFSLIHMLLSGVFHRCVITIGATTGEIAISFPDRGTRNIDQIQHACHSCRCFKADC